VSVGLSTPQIVSAGLVQLCGWLRAGPRTSGESVCVTARLWPLEGITLGVKGAWVGTDARSPLKLCLGRALAVAVAGAR
jgi:hypothetical protein